MVKKLLNKEEKNITTLFGQDVFSLKVMRNYLSDKAYKSLSATITERKPLNTDIADEIAQAMMNWAVSKGATHFTHWFQPLTGTTAEKHDSFLSPDQKGGAFLTFSGKELIQGEPDASSFPSGGLRSTFEARGYTAWDPSSQAFIKRGTKHATLCIPTIFCGYHGQALDQKMPLLKSIEALSKQLCRLAKCFGIDTKDKRAYVTLGIEQEYFLVDKNMYQKRPDLIQTGRTLFGRRPAKHQQMEDHYFGAIKPRVMAFMEDLDTELWKQGIPVRTRHNEVAPAQFEMAPMFEEQNLAVDHNMMVMQSMKTIAEKHEFICLLHEKPFSGVNGSGKHNNWSVVGPDGKNWLNPGDTPHENAKFITMICVLLKAIDTNATLLRAAIASAGNDHRLGAHEAPPAIISIFLGDQLTDIIEQIEKGGAKTSKKKGIIELGVSLLPKLPKDATDRNRTSPFAFTGNKFEFRAVGSSMNCAGANIVLNTIVADALDEVCSKLEDKTKGKKNFNAALQDILHDIIKKHKKIIFNGDNYTDAWKNEANKRGLPHITKTPDCIKKIEQDTKIMAMFAKHCVLSKEEFCSRNDIAQEIYEKIITIERDCAITMTKTMILPAAVSYMHDLFNTLRITKSTDKNIPLSSITKYAKELAHKIDKAFMKLNQLESYNNEHSTIDSIKAMNELRIAIDELEKFIPKDMWPLPTYADMVFLM